MQGKVSDAALRVYVRTTIGLGVATVLLSRSGEATLLVFLPVIGWLLLLAPTLFCYALAMAPAALIRRRGANRAAVVAVALLGLVGLGYGLPRLATVVAERQAAAAVAQDPFLRRAAAPRRIEFIEKRLALFGARPLARMPCDAICQKLLIGGEADAVRISSSDRFSGPMSRTDDQVTYRFERRATCPAAFTRGDVVEPATARALVEGRCIVPDLAATDAMDVRVIHRVRDPGAEPESERAVASPGFPPLVAPGAEKRLEIFDLQDPQPTLLRLQITPTWRVPPTPFYLSWVGSRPGGDRLLLRSVTRALPSIDIEQALRETLGYRLDADLKAAPAPDAALVSRILTGTDATPFGAEKQKLVGEVMHAIARKPALDETDVALLRRVVADARIAGVNSLADAFSRHPGAAEEVVAGIFARLARPPADAGGDMHSQLARALARMPPARLLPHRQQIEAILAADPGWDPAPLMIALGRLGGDPTALFADRLKFVRGSVVQAAATAICAADPALAPKLLPIIRATLDRAASAERGVPNGETTVIMLVALRRHGFEEEARMRLAQFARNRDDHASLTRDVFTRRAASGVRMCDQTLLE